MKLYSHQETFVNDIRRSLGKHKAIIARADTGMGKTVIAGYIALKADVLMTVHRKELKRQTIQTFEKMGAVARVETVQSLIRTDFTPPKILIVDECHLSMSKTFQRVIKKCLDAGSYVLGLTATPCRLDGRPLGETYKAMVAAPDMKWLIENKYLSNYNYHAPYVPDMQGAKKRAGDYATSDILSIMNGKVIANALDLWSKRCPNARTIAFCASIEHSKQLVVKAKEKGIHAVHIDGTFSDKKRKEAIMSFVENRGILSNVALLTEGFDLSAQVNQDITIEAVMLLRPTQSLALHRQTIGRALRKKSYPAEILDFAGNVQRHGLPDDNIPWTLEGKIKKQSDAISIQRCPSCFHVQRPASKCSDCGHIFEADGKIIEEIAGELVLIDTNAWHSARARQVKEASTLEELVKIEKSRCYKVGWAEINYEKKNGNRPTLEDRAEARGYSQAWVWKAKQRNRR